MQGLMQDRPLLISSLIEHAAAMHPDAEIVSRTVEGPLHRCTYGDIHRRSKQVANALAALGVKPGDRIATLAWNSYRHMELYYGVSGTGAVLHTINPRLFPEQIAYIVNHAEDRYLFFDLTFAPLVESAGSADRVRQGLRRDDRPRAHAVARRAQSHLLRGMGRRGSPPDYEWPVLDERTASSLCYTSGTTGNPKGVLYSHRSTLLHSYAACMVDSLASRRPSRCCSWCRCSTSTRGACPMRARCPGAKLVLPGPALDGKSVYALMQEESVTLALGVPTVWLMLLQHVDAAGLDPKRDLVLRRVVIGGSAAPRAMSERFETQFGAYVVHAWGMTEMSPLGTVCNLLPKHRGLDLARRLDVQAKQGRAMFGVEMKISDDAGRAAAA